MCAIRGLSLRSPDFLSLLFFFFFNDTATTEIYTLSLHDALPISFRGAYPNRPRGPGSQCGRRSEEHTSELQSRENVVCRLLLEKKKKKVVGQIAEKNKNRKQGKNHQRTIV